MKEIIKHDLIDEFPIGEAFVDCIYGKIRQGKTYTATALIWSLLREGNVVYANWPVNFDGYNERDYWYYRLMGILGLKKNFLVVPKENLKTFDLYAMNVEEFFDWFKNLTDCVVVIDEAQLVFDSYLKTLMDKGHRMTLFATGHFNRALKVVTQRPMQLHTSIRGNIARYYKVEKIFEGRWIIPMRFKLTEFQELRTTDAVPNEDIDENGEYIHAESIKRFWLKKKIANSFDTKYLRGDMKPSQKNLAQIWEIPWKKRFKKDA